MGSKKTPLFYYGDVSCRHTLHFAHAAARPTARRPRSRPARAHAHRPAWPHSRRARPNCTPGQAQAHGQVSCSAPQACRPHTSTHRDACLAAPARSSRPPTRRPPRPRTPPARVAMTGHPSTSMHTSTTRLAHFPHFFRRTRPLPARSGRQDARQWPRQPRRCRRHHGCCRGRLYRCRRGWIGCRRPSGLVTGTGDRATPPPPPPLPPPRSLFYLVLSCRCAISWAHLRT